MIATFTVYADFQVALRTGFMTVSPVLYYFDDTAGSGTFFVYAIYWAGGDALQFAGPKPTPTEFSTDQAVKLSSAIVLS